VRQDSFVQLLSLVKPKSSLEVIIAFLFVALLLMATTGMHRNNVVGQRQLVSPQTGPCSSGSWSEEIQSEIPDMFHGIRSEYTVAKKDNFSAAAR
jgi:hypothetical protein